MCDHGCGHPLKSYGHLTKSCGHDILGSLFVARSDWTIGDSTLGETHLIEVGPANSDSKNPSGTFVDSLFVATSRWWQQTVTLGMRMATS